MAQGVLRWPARCFARRRKVAGRAFSPCTVGLQPCPDGTCTEKVRPAGAEEGCGIAVWGYGMREVNMRSNWDEEKRVPFEDMMAPIPVGYDNYLRGIYGDYMKLPPEEKRETHHDFEAWWKS